jgi:hypothetical protein
MHFFKKMRPPGCSIALDSSQGENFPQNNSITAKTGFSWNMPISAERELHRGIISEEMTLLRAVPEDF